MKQLAENKPVILATKSGWLIAAKLIRETPKAFIVQAVDEKEPRRVEKSDKSRGIFENCDQAMAWQDGKE